MFMQSSRTIHAHTRHAHSRHAHSHRLFAGALFGALFILTCDAIPAQEQATAVVTALPKSGEARPITAQQIQLLVNGKKTAPTVWRSYGSEPVELVVLIDSGARTSIGTDLEEVGHFIADLPPNVSAGVAYMINGRAMFTAPLSTDHAAVAKQLHLPGGTPGSNASPYFCISDLAKRWPAARGNARREVLMITDGVDEYYLRYDPSDPYVKAAIADSQRAGLVLYSIYFKNQGRLGSSFYETNAGQNYLQLVTEETGGNNYYEGLGNPVSFSPFLSDLSRQLMNQYELGFDVAGEKKESFAAIKVRASNSDVKLRAPLHVTVPPVAK